MSETTTVTVPAIAVTVRRDAHTITPTEVLKHELPIIRTLFGKENVTEQGVVGSIDIDPEAEQQRLGAKYGIDAVVQIFGDDDGTRLVEAVHKAAVKPEPPAKTTTKAAVKPEPPAETTTKAAA